MRGLRQPDATRGAMVLHPGVHPALHPLFEVLAYVSGFACYQWQRRRSPDFLGSEQRWEILAAAAVGALAGSRLLGLLEQWPFLHRDLIQTLLSAGGKTIVGGLLGGWAAVELAKRILGIRQRTGDMLAVPICVGLAVGRVGCLLAGLADDTYGIPTHLRWGIDMGDGIVRQPVQLYEILFLALLAVSLERMQHRKHRQGDIFRCFLAAYLLFRLMVDFLKPQPPLFGMSAIQWASLAGLAALALGALQSNSTLASTEQISA